MNKQTIKHWAEDDRPREKLLIKGAEALSNSELIAIILQSGTKEKTAVDVAKELLQAVNNNLNKLGGLSVSEITKLKIKGIGFARAIGVVAALELGIRRKMEQLNLEQFKSSKDAALFLKARLEDLSYEAFAVVYLNNNNAILEWEIVSEGGLTSAIVDNRIVLKKALNLNATKMIICHNHPSGSLLPSNEDKNLTRKLKEASTLLDIQLLDHIIVSKQGYFSFADEGLL